MDSFESGQEIPSCQLTAVWIRQSEPSQLRQKVTLIGAKEPFNYLYLELDSTPPDNTGGELFAKSVKVALSYYTISTLDKYLHMNALF